MPDMAFDFSAFPEEEKPVSLKEMPFDFSAFPEQPKTETLYVDFSDIPYAQPSAVAPADQSTPYQPAAHSEEPGLQSPTLLPHSLSPQAIKEL
jgi:hypothetical protein